MNRLVRTVVLGALALAAFVSCGTPGGSPAELGTTMLTRCLELERRALQDNEAIAILRSLVTAAPKRLAGSPGMFAAEQWAMDKMREIGFDEVRAEPVMVPNWQRGVEAGAVVSPGGASMDVFDPKLSRWVRQYINAGNRRFVRLEGEVDGSDAMGSMWRVVGGSRRSQWTWRRVGTS